MDEFLILFIYEFGSFLCLCAYGIYYLLYIRILRCLCIYFFAGIYYLVNCLIELLGSFVNCLLNLFLIDLREQFLGLG